MVVLAEELLGVGSQTPGFIGSVKEPFKTIINTKLVIRIKGERGFVFDDEVINAAFGSGDGGAGAHRGQQQHIEPA
jgi:hypothetical protein